jgi:hypothetical protein
MTINLEPGCGTDVMLQFKHASYLVVHLKGHYAPYPQNPGQEHSPPLLVDFIEGKLHKESEQYMVTYANLVQPDQHIDMVVDPEDVARMWIVRRLISPIISSP